MTTTVGAPENSPSTDLDVSFNGIDDSIDFNDVEDFLDDYLNSEESLSFDHFSVETGDSFDDNVSTSESSIVYTPSDGATDVDELSASDHDMKITRKAQRPRQSQYRGVSRVNGATWGAKYSSTRIGWNFKSEEEAAKAYDDFLLKHYPKKHNQYCNFCPQCGLFRNPLGLKGAVRICQCNTGKVPSSVHLTLPKKALSTVAEEIEAPTQNTTPTAPVSSFTTSSYTEDELSPGDVVSVTFKTTFLTKYWRNARRNIQCFPYCAEFGDFFSMKLSDAKHRNPGACKSSVLCRLVGPIVYPEETKILGRINFNPPEELPSVLSQSEYADLEEQCFIGEIYEDNEASIDEIAVRFNPEVWKFEEPLKTNKKRTRNKAAVTFCFEVFVVMKNGNKYDVLGRTRSKPFEFSSTRTALRKKKNFDDINNELMGLETPQSPITDSQGASSQSEYLADIMEVDTKSTESESISSSSLSSSSVTTKRAKNSSEPLPTIVQPTMCLLYREEPETPSIMHMLDLEEAESSIATQETLDFDLDYLMALKNSRNMDEQAAERKEKRADGQTKVASPTTPRPTAGADEAAATTIEPKPEKKLLSSPAPSQGARASSVPVSKAQGLGKEKKPLSRSVVSKDTSRWSEASLPVNSSGRADGGRRTKMYLEDKEKGEESEERELSRVEYLTRYYGWCGAHHFYLRRPRWGCLYLFSFGLGGFGWWQDIRRCRLLTAAANRQIFPETLGESDYSVLLRSPLGIFGAHRFYTHKPLSGFAYLSTGGILLLGWMYDLYRDSSWANANDDQTGRGEDMPLVAGRGISFY